MLFNYSETEVIKYLFFITNIDRIKVDKNKRTKDNFS